MTPLQVRGPLNYFKFRRKNIKSNMLGSVGHKVCYIQWLSSNKCIFYKNILRIQREIR